MRRIALVGLGLAAAVAAVVTAFGRTDDSSEHCFKDEGEAAITACTRAIRSGRLGGAALAAIYENRGIELRQQGEFDRAIADYSQAITLDATLTGAYTGRGLAYEGKTELDKAKVDYRKALTVAPKNDDGQWAHETARGRLAAIE